MPTKICALCLEPNSLKNSHIFPEYLYKSLYSERLHRFLAAPADPKKQFSFLQRGLRELLLCGACETDLSVFEGYFEKVVLRNLLSAVEGPHVDIKLTGLDYPKIRLFQLSLIWRASVSTLEAFSQVSLVEDRERLRRMIKEKNPGEPDDFGCSLKVLIYEGQVYGGIFIPPVRYILEDGIETHSFLIGGLQFTYLTKPPPWPVSAQFVQTNGSMLVLCGDVANSNFVRAADKQFGVRWE